MSHELKEGLKIKQLTLLPNADGTIVLDTTAHTSVMNGGYIINPVNRITVAEQIGQMGMVPWAKVEYPLWHYRIIQPRQRGIRNPDGGKVNEND